MRQLIFRFVLASSSVCSPSVLIQQNSNVGIVLSFCYYQRIDSSNVCSVSLHHLTIARSFFYGRRVYTPLYALNPPSTGMTTPVTKPDAGLQSQSNVLLRSSGLPNLPSGV